MTVSKEYTPDGWVAYSNHLKKSLDRNLTDKENKLALQRYITGISVERTLAEFTLEEIGK